MRYLMTLALIGCAPSLLEEKEELDTTTDGMDTTTVVDTGTAPTDPGLQPGEYMVDATDYIQWVYYDVTADEFLVPGEIPDGEKEWTPSPDEVWHMAFRRFNIKLNGGASGDGEVAGLEIEGQDYEALTQAPADGYEMDGEDFNADGVPEYVFKDWYDYDYSSHILTPKDKVYVIRLSDDEYYKFQHIAYYDDPGTPGMVSYRMAPIDSP